jgi:hypothetical protein
MTSLVSSPPTNAARLAADERFLEHAQASHDAARREVLATLARLSDKTLDESRDEAAPRAASVATLLLAGAAARLTSSSDEAADDAELATRALDRLRAATRGVETSEVRAFAQSISLTNDDPTLLCPAITQATQLLAGARALGVEITDGGLESLAEEVERCVDRLLASHDALAPTLVGSALLANQQLASWGAALPADAPLARLADALVPTLAAAFRGVALAPVFDASSASVASVASPSLEEQSAVAPASVRAPTPAPAPAPHAARRTRALRPEELRTLSAVLKRALDSDDPLRIEPSLLELTPFFLASSAPDLVLHEDAHDESLVVQSSPLPGTVLRLHLDAVELELLDPTLPEPLLLPIVGEVALEPCRCRAGMTARHFVFEPSDHPAVEAYALLLGDRVALLRA